jgi:hypothetical protein
MNDKAVVVVVGLIHCLVIYWISLEVVTITDYRIPFLGKGEITTEAGIMISQPKYLRKYFKPLLTIISHAYKCNIYLLQHCFIIKSKSFNSHVGKI